MKPVDIEERFWGHVQKVKGCWLWTASYDRHGYGQFCVGHNGKKRMCRAHRIAWALTYGPVPEGMLVLHHCDNTLCVRPEHLKLGTKRSNSRDMMSKGRWRGNQFVGEVSKRERTE
jgi:hypothetical protein